MCLSLTYKCEGSVVKDLGEPLFPSIFSQFNQHAPEVPHRSMGQRISGCSTWQRAAIDFIFFSPCKLQKKKKLNLSCFLLQFPAERDGYVKKM